MKRFARLLPLAWLIVSGAAHAVPVTFALTGTIQDRLLPDPPDPLSGQSFWSYLTVDDSPLFASSTFAQYGSSGSPYGMVFSVNGLVGVADSVSIKVSNDELFMPVSRPVDYVFLTATGSSLFFQIWLANFDLDTIDSVALFPDPARFDDYCFEIMVCVLEVGHVGTAGGLILEDLSVTRLPFAIPVPMFLDEPGPLPLLASGVATLALLLRQRAGVRQRQMRAK